MRTRVNHYNSNLIQENLRANELAKRVDAAKQWSLVAGLNSKVDGLPPVYTHQYTAPAVSGFVGVGAAVGKQEGKPGAHVDSRPVPLIAYCDSAP